MKTQNTKQSGTKALVMSVLSFFVFFTISCSDDKKGGGNSNPNNITTCISCQNKANELARAFTFVDNGIHDLDLSLGMYSATPLNNQFNQFNQFQQGNLQVVVEGVMDVFSSSPAPCAALPAGAYQIRTISPGQWSNTGLFGNVVIEAVGHGHTIRMFIRQANVAGLQLQGIQNIHGEIFPYGMAAIIEIDNINGCVPHFFNGINKTFVTEIPQ